jgi:hypothetical protein
LNFVGIDPGVSGGMATIDYSGHVVDVRRMPDEDGIWEWANWLNSLPVESVVWIESVSGYIGNAHPGSRMFEFGMNYGSVRMAIKAAKGHLPNGVLPQDWQRYLGIEPRRKGKRGEDRMQFKRRLKGVAQELFPDVKVTANVADALLIAEYGRRVYGK